MGYAVALSPAAEREWRKIERATRERVYPVLLALESEPRTPGVTKLQGEADRWRLRVGDHRVIYRIDDQAQAVTVLRIAIGEKSTDRTTQTASDRALAVLRAGGTSNPQVAGSNPAWGAYQ